MNIGWKLISMGITAAAGAVANATAGQVWEKGLGKTKPTSDEEMESLPLKEIILFTAVTAIVHATVTTVMRRKAAEWYGKN